MPNTLLDFTQIACEVDEEAHTTLHGYRVCQGKALDYVGSDLGLCAVRRKRRQGDVLGTFRRRLKRKSK